MTGAGTALWLMHLDVDEGTSTGVADVLPDCKELKSEFR